ncbi:hypothetical protein [Dyadobacter sp. 676]|uniref:Uncharacterized protein n=1 Tax=Dyadobacter sp. 676 TaxID=3088362 RepID=A0AAU8FHG0_9BACT
MLLTLIVLAAIVVPVILFFRAGRRNTMVYRKKVPDCNRGYSVSDYTGVTAGSQDGWSTGSGPIPFDHETTAFGGGDFGGGGGGDSYDMANSDPADSGSCDSSSDTTSDSPGSDPPGYLND